jgi:hypothetical protein
LVKDEKGDLLADSHSILKDGRITSISCWMNAYSQAISTWT